MTTTLRSKYGHEVGVGVFDGYVSLTHEAGLQPDTPRSNRLVDRAEFLAAISAELGVIVIPKADLPSVTELNGVHVAGSARRTFGTPADYRRYALSALAIAEHLAANPPLDEAEVDVIASVIDGADEPSGLTTEQIFRVARRLVRAGVRAPEEAGR